MDEFQVKSLKFQEKLLEKEIDKRITGLLQSISTDYSMKYDDLKDKYGHFFFKKIVKQKCSAKTKKGASCSRNAPEGMKFCRQHENTQPKKFEKNISEIYHTHQPGIFSDDCPRCKLSKENIKLL